MTKASPDSQEASKEENKSSFESSIKYEVVDELVDNDDIPMDELQDIVSDEEEVIVDGSENLQL